MITRTVMEDASMQSIHHKARHTAIHVEDIKKKRKNSKFLSDKLPVAQLLKIPCLSWNPLVYSRLHNSPITRFMLIHLNPLHNLTTQFFKIHSK